MIQALCPCGNCFVTLHAQQQPRPETQDGKLHIICMGSDCIAATATGTAVQSKGAGLPKLVVKSWQPTTSTLLRLQATSLGAMEPQIETVG